MVDASTQRNMLEKSDELGMLHEARAKNALPPLKYSPLLAQAATAHSQYMAFNHTCGHDEYPGAQGFSGRNVQERALGTAYQYRGSSENLNCSNDPTWTHSIDSLMRAIYHRLAFLSFDVDEIGFSYHKAQSGDPVPHKFTYVMGNSMFRELCEKVNQTKSLALPESLPAGTYMRNFCKIPNAMVHASIYHKAKQTLAQKSSSVVVYPWPGQKNVFPAFLDTETPDPTPTLQLSGMPVSIQFNPVYFKEIQSVVFSLKDSKGNPVDVWRLDAMNDAHELLSDYQYVWFPVRPLERGTQYIAQVDYVADEKKYQKTWSFHTQAHQHKSVWPIDEQGQTIIAPKGQRTVIQWHGQTNEVVSHIACRCVACKPRFESFDTVSLLAESQDISCDIKDKAGQRITFRLQSL